MGNEEKKQFNTKAFVALMVLISALGLPITGIANHELSEQEMGQAGLSVARHAWMSAHNFLGLIFVVFAIWHIILNRRPLWNHIKGSAKGFALINKEMIFAVILMAFLLFIGVGHAFLLGH